MNRYNLGEAVRVVVLLYDDYNNPVPGKTVLLYLQKPTNEIIGPYTMIEVPFFTGAYEYTLNPENEIDIEGDYYLKFVCEGFKDTFDMLLVRNYMLAPGISANIVDVTLQTKEKISEESIPYVHIYFLSNNVTLFYALTNEIGVIRLSIPSGTYSIRGYKSGYVFTTIDMPITADGTIVISGNPISIPAPTTPDLCRVVIHTVDLGLEAVAGVEVKVTYNIPIEVGDTVGIGRLHLFYTDVDGTTYFDAPKGASVVVQIPKAGINTIVKIPIDKDVVYFTELI